MPQREEGRGKRSKTQKLHQLCGSSSYRGRRARQRTIRPSLSPPCAGRTTETSAKLLPRPMLQTARRVPISLLRLPRPFRKRSCYQILETCRTSFTRRIFAIGHPAILLLECAQYHLVPLGTRMKDNSELWHGRTRHSASDCSVPEWPTVPILMRHSPSTFAIRRRCFGRRPTKSGRRFGGLAVLKEGTISQPCTAQNW